MDCLHKVWILTLSFAIHGLSAQLRIEHVQSTDWGNPWIGVLIKGWYPLWLNRGGLLVRIAICHCIFLRYKFACEAARQGCIVLFMEHLNYEHTPQNCYQVIWGGAWTIHGLPAQSKDPYFVQDNPWIVQIHTLSLKVAVHWKY